MTDTAVIDIGAPDDDPGRQALPRPILSPRLAIGFAVSLFQSVTQIQEVTLTFVPKLIGVGLVILLAATGCCTGGGLHPDLFDADAPAARAEPR